MTEKSRSNTSSFLIALDPQEGHNGIDNITQNLVAMKVPLLRAKSSILKPQHSNLLSEDLQWGENNEQLEGMSILEESYSCLTQNEPKQASGTRYLLPKKTSKKYNRKEKSLGELLQKFIYLYGAQNYWIIALDECTYTLGVERRRIYDIINILESFNVLSRLAKNQYEWRGVRQIESSIQRMRGGSKNEVILGPLKKKKKKSLGILCESFIKLFLNWRSIISLEQAARRISDSHIDESKLKTKVRRLYDIANVLVALNLIEKTSLDTRKPAFKWVGETGLKRFMEKMEQHFKTNSESEPWASNHFSRAKIDSNDLKTSQFNYSNSKYSEELPLQILNSKNRCNSFKNVGSLKEEALEFSNLNTNSEGHCLKSLQIK